MNPNSEIRELKDKLKHEIASYICRVESLIGVSDSSHPGFLIPEDMKYVITMFDGCSPWILSGCYVSIIAFYGYEDDINQKYPLLYFSGPPVTDNSRRKMYEAGESSTDPRIPDLDVESYAIVYYMFQEWFSPNPNDYRHLLDKVVSYNQMIRKKFRTS